MESDDVTIEKLIHVFQEKVSSLKSNPTFLADKQNADRLSYYEKILARYEPLLVKQAADDKDFEQLSVLKANLDMWVDTWAVQK